MNPTLPLVLLAAVASLCACEDRSSPPRQPDNSGVNSRDRSGGAPTPPAQAEGSDADRNITADIRRAITSDSGFSVNARNIKIVTLNGAVTLRGPVETQAERDALGEKAKSVPGVKSVDNQLEVKKS